MRSKVKGEEFLNYWNKFMYDRVAELIGQKQKRPHQSPRKKLGQVIYSKTTTCPFVYRAARFPKPIIERLPKVLLLFQLTT
jgi:hypothetical protein